MSNDGSSTSSLFRGGPRELVTPPRGTLPGLDVLRSLAVILVISCHVAVDYAHEHGSFLLENFPLFSFGWTGVDLFFVLSGYLIGRQLWRELEKSNTIDVPVFLMRRGLRIWPLYFFFIALLSLVLHRDRPFASFVPDVFFFSNYRLGQVAGGWSLSTEEQFYIFTPLLLLLTRKLPISRMWIVLAAMFVALPLMRYLTYSGWLADGGQGVPPPSLLYWPFHLHADGLVMGLFLAWLATARPVAIAARDAARNWVAPLVLFLAGCALRQFEKYTFAYTGLALIYGGMTLFMLRDRSWITRLSAWRGFHTISRLSYGMYLNHFFVVPQVFEHVDAPAGGFDLLRFGAVYGTSLVLSMAAAAVTFCLVEHPFLMLRERWLEARRKTAVQRTA